MKDKCSDVFRLIECKFRVDCCWNLTILKSSVAGKSQNPQGIESSEEKQKDVMRAGFLYPKMSGER